MIRREGDVGRARNFKEMQPIKIHGVYKGSYACKGCGWLLIWVRYSPSSSGN